MSNVVDLHIGKQLKKLRKKRRMEIADLARSLDAEVAEIESMEGGRRIGADELFRICSVLNVAPTAFFKGLYDSPDRERQAAILPERGDQP